MTLGRSILLSKTALAVVIVAVLTTATVWVASTSFNQAVDTAHTSLAELQAGSVAEVERTAINDLTHSTQAAYALCQAQQETLQLKLAGDLNVARATLEALGTPALDDEQVTWQAANQFDGKAESVTLPTVRLGEASITPNPDLGQPSPVVDRVRELVGSTCTIFQRMNADGDLLRVCTNVAKPDGTRAIGTFLPAREPDGKPNAVVAAITKGETYAGRAFVVDRWYLTTYEPIRDGAGEVIGALYVGVPQESAASLRKAIMSTKIGERGYIFVINANGKTRGHYVISKDGKRDGENVWEAKDADGNFVIQTICQRGAALASGETTDVRYMWQNPGDAKPVEKVAMLSYFAPWDWVIGVSAELDDFRAGVNRLEEQSAAAVASIQASGQAAQRNLLWWSCGVGAGALLLAAAGAWLVTRSITRPVGRIVAGLTAGADQVNEAAGQVSSTAQSLAQGNSAQAATLEETAGALEEMAATRRQNAEHAASANERAAHARAKAAAGEQTMSQLNSAMGAINESSSKISKIIKVIEEIAFQTNLLALNAAVEAARAGEQGKGFAVVAEEVRNLAQRSADAARNTTALIEDSVRRAREGTTVAAAAGDSLQGINADVSQVAELIQSISQASAQQAQGIEQVNVAVTQLNQVTQENAAGAEQSASAAEELSAQSETMRQMVNDLAVRVGVQTA